MTSYSRTRNPRGGRAQRTAVHRVAALATTLALACTSRHSLAMGAAGGPVLEDESPPVARRSPRWWTEPWGHSMQEVAFIAWMDAVNKGTAWRLRMPVWQVEATYAWWKVNVWPFINGGG
jgi:hypothetical protein